jgi:DNA-directed RNA polymerase subunit RPC12/RpoP
MSGKWLLQTFGIQTVTLCQGCGEAVRGQQDQKEPLFLCRHCSGRSINRFTQAEPLIALVMEWLQCHRIRFGGVPVKIELRNHVQLREFMNGQWHPRMLGAAVRKVFSVPCRDSSKKALGIAVMRGLPPAVFRSILVHELGHTWLAVLGRTELGEFVEEGFCQWLASWHLTEQREPECRFQALRIREMDDPIYGDGFNAVDRFAGKLGHHGFMKLLVSRSSDAEIRRKIE